MQLIIILVGSILTLIGGVIVFYRWAIEPPSEAEIAHARDDAFRTTDPDKQALKWMLISNDEADLEISQEPNMNWFLIVGLLMITESILYQVVE